MIGELTVGLILILLASHIRVWYKLGRIEQRLNNLNNSKPTKKWVHAMQSKEWYASKGIWGGILVIVGVAAKVFVTGKVGPEDVTYFGAGLGLLGIRFAEG